MAHQIQGSENILQTLLGEHSIELVLVDRERDTKRLREVCLEQEIQLEEGSTNDLWRMSAVGTTDALPLSEENQKENSRKSLLEADQSGFLMEFNIQQTSDLEFEQWK